MKKIHFGLVSLCGALIAGTPVLAQQGSDQSSAESELASSTSQSPREILRNAGLESSEIRELSQNGFREQEVRQALAEKLQEEGQSSEQAEQRAERIARQVAQADQQSRTWQERDQQRSTTETAQRQGSERSSERQEARELAPEGAEIDDSATMVLNEEELDVETRRVPVGGILLRKLVVTDDASETIQLRREEIEVVRLSPEEAQQRQSENRPSGFGEDFEEGEIFIPLMREEADVEKEVTTRQVVRAQPTTETEEREIEATLRREEVEVERMGSLQEGQQTARQRSAQEGSAEERSASLEREIRNRLQSGDIGLSQQELNNIQIEVEEETVRLSGRVSNEQMKQRIEETVQGIANVGSIENELQTS